MELLMQDGRMNPTTRDLKDIAEEMRAAGVFRLRVGDIEVELDRTYVAPTQHASGDGQTDAPPAIDEDDLTYAATEGY